MAFMDTMNHMLDANFGGAVMANREQAGLLYLRDVLKDCQVSGKTLSELPKDEVKNATYKMSKMVLKHARQVASGMAMVSDEWKDEVSDLTVDQLFKCTDLVLAVTSPVYDSGDKSDEHTTMVKCPRNKVAVSFLLSSIHNLLLEVCAQGFEIKEPVELHQVLYDMFIMMACVEGNTAARVHMKNIDIANLNENSAVQAMIHDGQKLYKRQPAGKEFFDVVLTRNKYKEELLDALKTENQVLGVENDD